MADFKTALALTLARECPKDEPGRTTNIPGDAGGLTQWGISKVEHPELNVGSITPDQRDEFYLTRYWTPIRGNEISAQSEANRIFDTGVNMGVVTSIKMTQETLGVPQTGHMDDVTLKALNG